jgi:hypothetical protein
MQLLEIDSIFEVSIDGPSSRVMPCSLLYLYIREFFYRHFIHLTAAYCLDLTPNSPTFEINVTDLEWKYPLNKYLFKTYALPPERV